MRLACDADAKEDGSLPRYSGGSAGPGRVDCFDIEKEIGYWSHVHGVIENNRLSFDKTLYIDLLKFAYDSYVLFGGGNYEIAKISIVRRFSANSLQRRCDWATADRVCSIVWAKMVAGLPA